MSRPEAVVGERSARDELSAQTVALRLLVGLLVVGAAWWLSGLLIPFFLAAILAVALSPVADRLERTGLPRALAGVVCVLAVVAALAMTAGLVLYQAGSIVRDSDRYLQRFGQILAEGSRRVGGDRVVESFGVIRSGEGEADRAAPTDDEGRRAGGEASGASSDSADGPGPGRAWERSLRRGLLGLGRWVASGLGGLVGFLGGLVVFLAFLFYMLQTRSEWLERLVHGLRLLGLRPRREHLEGLRDEIVTYLGCLSLVSLGYAVLVSLVLWAVGLPQPMLWGVLAGLMEFVPYFGPLIASVLPTLVALSLGHWWQPAAVVAQYVGLHLLESYVVTPLLYGRAVRFDPVTILFGALFFGWIWGPLGLALALPMMILLRGLLVMSPDTPALDAFADVVEEKGEA